MSEFKKSGCCTICDAHCFEILQVWEPHEKLAGEPKRLGRPLDGATRVTFLLFDGTKTDLTFCQTCVARLDPTQYAEIWRKNLRSWLRQLGDERPAWFVRQFSSGLLCEMGRHPWKELVNG